MRRALLIGIAAVLAVGGCGGGGSGSDTSAKSQGVALATKKSLTHCLTAAGVHVDPSANLIGSKLEFQGLGTEYVGTVSFAGGSYGALWVGTGLANASPVQRVKDISNTNSLGPDLNPEPATLNYFWDHTRNIMFAFPTGFSLKTGDPTGAKFDQCLRTG